jgi:hypothetical protein
VSRQAHGWAYQSGYHDPLWARWSMRRNPCWNASTSEGSSRFDGEPRGINPIRTWSLHCARDSSGPIAVPPLVGVARYDRKGPDPLTGRRVFPVLPSRPSAVWAHAPESSMARRLPAGTTALPLDIAEVPALISEPWSRPNVVFGLAALARRRFLAPHHYSPRQRRWNRSGRARRDWLIAGRHFGDWREMGRCWRSHRCGRSARQD